MTDYSHITAWPQSGSASPGGDIFTSGDHGGVGLSFRDYFAGQALIGLALDPKIEVRDAAELAWRYADALLDRRESK